ncbi:hypothetical protein MN608_00900 [Microdochium nivale]|nr:hypothetical protein MN608_00900 [Microdochium nivale]
MAAHRYTSAELLELRDNARNRFASNAVAKIARNPDSADLLKRCYGEASAYHGRRSRSMKEDTSMSTDSDEQILFKGKGKSQPAENLSAWKYRGRAGSEVTASAPLSAPTGLAAQQSEGFKRFYKAVVSPSHVRVTAGGRIVPNTRPTSSPTARWDKEATPTPGREPTAPSIPDQGYPINGPMGPMVMPPSMYGQFMHFPQMVTQMPVPVPLYHLPNGYPLTYGNPSMSHLPDLAAAQAAQFHSSRRHETTSEDHSQDGRSTGDTSAKKGRPPPILVMPPDMRESTRPFMYQGQIIYPRPPVPGFMHSPYYSAPAMGTFPFPAQGTPPVPHPSSAPPMPTPAGPYVVTSEANSINSGDRTHQLTIPARQVSTPPLSSIKPSSVTKRQLDSLRSSLKYYEDQLAYNKHQIDEKGTQEQARKIRQSIAQFEHNLKLQQDFEAANYPKQMSESDATTSSSGDDPQRSQGQSAIVTTPSQIC